MRLDWQRVWRGPHRLILSTMAEAKSWHLKKAAVYVDCLLDSQYLSFQIYRRTTKTTKEKQKSCFQFVGDSAMIFISIFISWASYYPPKGVDLSEKHPPGKGCTIYHTHFHVYVHRNNVHRNNLRRNNVHRNKLQHYPRLLHIQDIYLNMLYQTHNETAHRIVRR